MKKLALVLAPLSVALAQEVLLEEVEIRAKRETLTQQEVRESFAKDPGEALSSMEGVWKLRKGGIASDIVLRGFSGRNLSVLFDGARIWGACPNRMDPPLFHVDFAEVKEMEVIKGPFDVRNYGSLGGTVNVVTAEPKKGLHGKLHLGMGSFSYFSPSLSLSYGADKIFGLVGYSYRYSKPYRTGEGKRFTEYANYRPDEVDATAFRISTVWTKIGLRPSKDSEVELSYTAQRARDLLYPYLMMDSPKDDADRLNLRVNYRRLKLNLYYSYIYHLMNNSKRTAMSFMETIAQTETYGIKAEYDPGSLSLGIEVFNWNWKAETRIGSIAIQNTIPDVGTTDLGIFGEYRSKLGKKLKLVAGLRLDTTQTKADRGKANTALYYRYHGTSSISKRDTYPSGNLQLSYTVSEGIELFGGIGHSVRVPDAQERYFALDRVGMMETRYGDWVGNPNLKPSRNTEIDLGLKLRTDRVSADLSIFYSFVKDFITLYNDTSVYGSPVGADSDSKARSYTNVDAQLYGGEAELTVALTDTLFLEGGTSYVRGRKDTDPSRNITDEDIAEIPPLKGRLALRFDAGIYFVQIEGIFQATQDRVDSDLKEQKTPGWGVVNLKAGGEYKSFRLVAGVENLFNKFYYEHLSYLRDPFSSGIRVPEPGRSFHVNLSYLF